MSERRATTVDGEVRKGASDASLQATGTLCDVEYGLLTVVNGRWKQNCYILTDRTKDALVIDPGSEAERITGLLNSRGLRPVAILNTHAHFDHVGAVASLIEEYGIPFYLHSSDNKLLQRANLYRLLFEGDAPIRVPKVSRNIAELPEIFQAGPFSIQWRHVPGHTEGSVLFQIGQFLFTGDTLMRGTVGRTDLPGGNRDQLIASLRVLMSLSPDLIVCGGHGELTSIGAEFAKGSAVWKLVQ